MRSGTALGWVLALSGALGARLRRLGRALLVLMLIGPLAACGDAAYLLASLLDTSNTVRFSVELDFVIDGEPASGRGVWEAYTTVPHFAPMAPMQSFVRGEAIRIDMEGRHIYALRRAEAGGGSHYGNFPHACTRLVSRSSRHAFVREIGRFRGPCILTVEQAQGQTLMMLAYPPLLVEFLDPLDPDSSRFLNYEWAEAGACATTCLITVTVARSREPLRRGIERELPWLTLGSGGYSPIGSGDHRWHPPPIIPNDRTLHRQDFSTELDGWL